jgi:hypothetical protein
MLRLGEKQNEPFKRKGEWWIPGSESKIVGDLEYSVRRMELRLHDFLHPPVRDPLTFIRPEDDQPAVIHGMTTKGEEVTLYKSWYQTWRPMGKRTQINETVVVTHIALFGGLLASSEVQKYQSCSFQLAGVNEWIQHDAFDTDQEDESDDDALFVTRSRLGKARQFNTPIGVFDLLSEISTGGELNQLTLTHDWTFQLTPSAPRNLEWFVKAIRHAERLLTLFCREPIHSLTCRLQLAKDDPANDGLSKTIYGCQLYFSHKRAAEKQLKRFDFLVQYDRVSEHLPAVFGAWFNEDDRLDDALHLFFSTIYQPGEYIETRFLPVVQALEVFSRELYQDTYIDQGEAKRILKKIRSGFGTDWHEGFVGSISARIAHANEPTLRDRLTMLIERLEEPTRRLFSVDYKRFVGGIVASRNFHTHYSAGRELTLKGMEMHWATVKMHLLMIVLLLKRAGLSESLIRESFGACYWTSSERQAWHKVKEDAKGVAPVAD